MNLTTEVRIDKYLWAVRIFKTRSIATEACKKGRIIIDGVQVKPSRNVKTGDIIQIKRPPVLYSFKVKALLEKRLGAKLVVDYVEDLTPQSELDKLEMKDSFFLVRDRGTGRPTKKDRREIERLMDWDNFEIDEE